MAGVRNSALREFLAVSSVAACPREPNRYKNDAADLLGEQQEKRVFGPHDAVLQEISLPDEFRLLACCIQQVQRIRLGLCPSERRRHILELAGAMVLGGSAAR